MKEEKLDYWVSPEVIYVPGSVINGGVYHVITNKVLLDNDLLVFPELHNKVLEHERMHSKYKNNPFFHAFWDIVDTVPVICSNEWKEYQNFRNKKLNLSIINLKN